MTTQKIQTQIDIDGNLISALRPIGMTPGSINVLGFNPTQKKIHLINGLGDKPFNEPIDGYVYARGFEVRDGDLGVTLRQGFLKQYVDFVDQVLSAMAEVIEGDNFEVHLQTVETQQFKYALSVRFNGQWRETPAETGSLVSKDGKQALVGVIDGLPQQIPHDQLGAAIQDNNFPWIEIPGVEETLRGSGYVGRYEGGMAMLTNTAKLAIITLAFVGFKLVAQVTFVKPSDQVMPIISDVKSAPRVIGQPWNSTNELLVVQGTTVRKFGQSFAIVS